MWSNAAANAGSSHGCGEHFVCRVLFLVFGGSSPRMRGAPRLGLLLAHSTGIIPADAGSTATGTPGCGAAPDHPRGCGEHDPKTGRILNHTGSSPRMRGAPQADPDHRPGAWIIPADAGSTTVGTLALWA